MANIVSNEIRISCDRKVMRRVLPALFTKDNKFSFTALLPEGSGDEDTRELDAKEWNDQYGPFITAKQDPFKLRGDHKMLDGWKWRMVNWGCAYDCYDAEVIRQDPESLHVRFCTSWSHAAPWYEKLKAAFPEAKIEYAAADPAMDWIYRNGETKSISSIVDYFTLKRKTLEENFSDEYDIEKLRKPCSDEDSPIEWGGVDIVDLFDSESWRLAYYYEEEALEPYRKPVCIDCLDGPI